jgi:hypothetical protein
MIKNDQMIISSIVFEKLRIRAIVIIIHEIPSRNRIFSFLNGKYILQLPYNKLKSNQFKLLNAKASK